MSLSSPHVALFSVAVLLSSGAQATDLPGRLDPTFGVAGRQVLHAPAERSDELAGATALLGPGGSIYLVGTGFDEESDQQAISIARFDANGGIDASFDGDGVVSVLPATMSSAVVNAAMFDTSERLLVAGKASVQEGDALVVCRLDAAGVLDPTFGLSQSGCYTLAATGAEARDVLVQQGTDRIILAGSISSNGASLGLLVALSGEGAGVDASFGAGFGLQFIPFAQLPSPSRFHAIAQNAFGELVAVGSRAAAPGDEDFLVFQLDVDGQPSADFGNNGFMIGSFDLAPMPHRRDEATSAVLFDDRSVLVGGFAQSDASSVRPAVLKLLATADADESFVHAGSLNDKGAGFADYDVCNDPCDARANALAVLPDGRIVLAGSAAEIGGDEHFMVLKLSKTGAPDPVFGTPPSSFPGVAIVPFEPMPDSANPRSAAFSVAPQHDQLLIAGLLHADADPLDEVPGTSHFAIARLGNGHWLFGDGFE